MAPLESWIPPRARRCLPWVAIFLFLGGALIRVRWWLAGRSLWLDEAFVALNLVDRGYLELASPLSYRQMAPIGFLWIEKTLIAWFGSGELSLRAFPLFCGIAMAALAGWVAWRAFGPFTAFIVLAILSVSDSLVYYSNELKPYSSDAFVVAGWLALAQPWSSARWSAARRIGLSCAAMLAVLLSFPSPTAIAGTALARAGGQWVRGERRDLVIDLGLLAPAAGVALLQLWLLMANTEAQWTESYWATGFLPFPPTSFNDLRQLVQQYFQPFDNLLGIWFLGLAGALFAIGMIVCFKERRELATALLLPIAFLFIASALEIYPTTPRMILFIAPLLALGVGAGTSTLLSRTRDVPLAGVVLVAILLGFPLLGAASLVRKPMEREHLRPLLEQLAEARRPGDFVYVYYGAQYAYAYYAPKLDLLLDAPLDAYVEYDDESSERGPVPPGDSMTIGISSRAHPDRYPKDLARLEGQSRVWVVMAHVWPPSEMQVFESTLDDMGERFFDARTEGARLMGYQLDGAPARESSSARR